MFKKNSKRWKRKDYPENWEELSLACKEAAHWLCQRCRCKHGKKRISRAGKPYRVKLAACHADPYEPKSCSDPLLICLCEKCHAWYDAPYKARQRYFKHERNKHRILLARKGFRVATTICA